MKSSDAKAGAEIMGVVGTRFSNNQLKMSWASCRSVFCFRTRFVRIFAAFPIHNSNSGTASRRSNQRAYLLAFMPSRTRIGCCLRAR